MLQRQEQDLLDQEPLYNQAEIRLVIELMAEDNPPHPEGRLCLLSVRNDKDAPLFSPLVRSDQLIDLLEAAPIARLLAELKALLPQRQRLKDQEIEKQKLEAELKAKQPPANKALINKRANSNKAPSLPPANSGSGTNAPGESPFQSTRLPIEISNIANLPEQAQKKETDAPTPDTGNQLSMF